MSPLIDQSRRENSAEHSWHLAMYALVLSQYAAAPVNVERVVKMLLLHDIVEIDAGDTPFHHASMHAAQAERDNRRRSGSLRCCPMRRPNSATCGASLKRAERRCDIRQGARPLSAIAS
jgi:hypothetical protein